MSRRKWIFIPAALLALLAAPFALAFGPGGHGGFGHCGSHHGPMDFSGDEAPSAEQVRTGLGFMASMAFDEIDATDAQRDHIDGVLDAIAPDLASFRAEGQEIREAVHAELDKDAPDPAVLEQLRVDGIDLADRASQRALEAYTDATSVLEPAQRRALKDLREKMHGEAGPGWRQGRRGR